MVDTEVMETLAQEPQEAAEQIQEQPSHQQEEVVDKSAHNLRMLREKATRIERERDEALRQLQEIQARSSQNTQQPEDDEFNIGPDDIAEGKHLSKVTRKVQALREELKQLKQQTASESIETRLRNQYPDFDRIVTADNISALREAYPEIAHTIHSSPDLYSRAASAYTIIKKMGIYQDTSGFDADKAAAQKNAYKPKPTASIAPQQGDSPMSKANAFANGLTPELKEQLLKEMYASRKAR